LKIRSSFFAQVGLVCDFPILKLATVAGMTRVFHCT
jgi:hypothetical protein